MLRKVRSLAFEGRNLPMRELCTEFGLVVVFEMLVIGRNVKLQTAEGSCGTNLDSNI